MSKISRIAPLLLALSTLGLGACAPASDDTEPTRTVPRVIATTGMIADLAERIGGTLIEVDALMGPGIDPHLYKASAGDVERLAEADLILYNGLYLEGKMGDILDKLARGRAVVAVAESIEERHLLYPPDAGGHPDPHIWFDVSLWAETVAPTTEALVALLPEHEATLRERADTVRTELLELDAWVSAQMATIPEEQRVLVTAHDAFGYFGARYGIEVVGIQGLSTVAEAGLRDVERVVELIAARAIPALFVESSVPRRSVEAVQSAVRDAGHEVAIGGELFSDAMGAPGTPEGEYFGMVRSNVETIVGALAQ
ncbi:MAG: zinc ABC transporter substrate-binding protein [Acidobacteriota bacterium]